MMWPTFKMVLGISLVQRAVMSTLVLSVVLFLTLSSFVSMANASDAKASEIAKSQQWQKTLSEARGQTVYFYAWGGSKPINDYLRWASKEISSRYKVRLRHVKVADISEAVSRLKAEDGSKSAIDLLWINGENFSYLKQQQLLLGNLWSTIPNSALLATQQLSLQNDFGVAIDGFEVPWGVGQFNIIAKAHTFTSNRANKLKGTDKLASSQAELTPERILQAAKQHPGQFSYPRPPEFHGTTFLKQLLVALSNNDQRLFSATTPEAKAKLLPLLWDYLDQLHPVSWQQGRAFPSSNTEQLSLFQQNQLDIAVSFNPNQISKEKEQKRISDSAELFYFAQGAITNSHNLAIPKGAQSPAGAKVVINFLLSDLAQKEKLNGSWGDPAVITPLLKPATTLPSQQELHSSWQQLIEEQWQQKYGA